MERLRAGSLGALIALCAGCASPLQGGPEPLAPQERQCVASGWQRADVQAAGLTRRLLWKGPKGAWSKGAILVMHGGGGYHYHWCVANAAIIAPQVRFAELAVSEGFGVLLLDSSDLPTDNEGRACGKVWDDEVRARPNLDLPFIGEVIGGLLPRLRPAGSRTEVFLTGLSSGGYMTLRAATRFDDRIAAFAPVSSGDPYGWFRVCRRGMTARTTVHGVAYDRETRRMISEPGACRANAYPNERPWDSARPARKPPFRFFHHRNDGIHDLSCADKARAQLLAHGYPEAPPLVLEGGRRSYETHLWQDEYSRPLLEFFASRLKAR